MNRYLGLIKYINPHDRFLGFKEGDTFINKEGYEYLYTLFKFDSAKKRGCSLGCMDRRECQDIPWIVMTEGGSAAWVGKYDNFTDFFTPTVK